MRTYSPFFFLLAAVGAVAMIAPGPPATAAEVEIAWEGISRGCFAQQAAAMRTVEFELPITTDTFATIGDFYLVVDYGPMGGDDDDREQTAARARRGSMKVAATLMAGGNRVKSWKFKGREDRGGYAGAFKRIRGQNVGEGDVIVFEIRFKGITLPALEAYEILAGIVRPDVFQE